MGYQNNITWAIPIHSRSMYILDPCDQMVKPGSDLLGTLPPFAAISPYIPSSFSVQSMFMPQRPDLMGQSTLVEAVVPFCQILGGGNRWIGYGPCAGVRLCKDLPGLLRSLPGTDEDMDQLVGINEPTMTKHQFG